MPFIPLSITEASQRGWNEFDVVFVTGDAYIDHPSFGVPLLARWLEFHGLKVGIISQPDWRSVEAFKVLGRPRLFFAVSAGAMDSMVAHYTPARKLRHDDAYTPGNRHGARPNRACIVYTSRLKEAWKDVPVVLGGIEASLRRLAHYDFWEDKVRRSILFDAKADLLVYGMGERPLLELAQRLAKGETFRAITDINGTAHVAASDPIDGGGSPFVELPSFEQTRDDKSRFAAAYMIASREQNPHNARRMVQRHGDRYLICNPPAASLSGQEIDVIYALPFAKSPHPTYKEPIPAWEQIRSSITTHRGCCGGCAFCAIAQHQGTHIQSRTEDSIAAEVDRMVKLSWFRGSISDVGGPTANMYGVRCSDAAARAACRRSSCLAPSPCKNLDVADGRGARLLRRIRGHQGVKHVAVSSGIRFDLLEHQPAYLAELLAHHVGGLLKVAPEHLVDRVTELMHKPGRQQFERFLTRFRQESEKMGKRQHVLPYLMSGHPGCTLNDMIDLALLLKKNGLKVEQVQDFTPTPATLSTCMYYTGVDPQTGRQLHVARTDREKRLQKSLLLCHVPGERKLVLEALRACGREDAAAVLLGAPSHGLRGKPGSEAVVGSTDRSSLPQIKRARKKR